MGYTAIINNNPIVLPPVGAVSPALNPVYTACDPTNGNYFLTTGRDLVTFNCAPAADASSWVSTTIYTAGQVVNFGLTATITQIAVASDILTVTCVNTFQAGEVVRLAGLTTATFLNAQSVTILTANAAQFTASFTNANYGPASDTGTVTIPSATYIALVSSTQNLNIQPTSTAGATLWGTYADGDSTVTLYSAPDACTGRKADIDDYPVPVATEAVPVTLAANTEFLVLPSSTFTQANQQFQFLASSNLVSVYVRNF